MKSVVAVTLDSLDEYLECGQKSFLLPLKDYSVSYQKTYTLKEIQELREKYPDVELFIVMNKTIFNEELEKIENILRKIDSICIQGILFYDLAILELKQKNSFQTKLVWNQTHMVTNSKTCDFYLHQGVDYAVIAGELEKSEIVSLVENTKMKLFYTLVSKPVIAHSRRSLITNYKKMSGEEKKCALTIYEKVKQEKYLVTEDKGETSFFCYDIPNHYSILKDVEFDYVILNESYMEHSIFMQFLKPTVSYLEENISIDQLLDIIHPILGEKSFFLNNKTIYRVKKEGK